MQLTLSYPKTCILCRHFCFYAGNSGYTEWTPGDKWEAICSKLHWKMGGEEVTTEEYRKTLLTANTCPDFDLCNLLKNNLPKE